MTNEVGAKLLRGMDAYVQTNSRHPLLGRVATEMTQQGHINPSEAVKAHARLVIAAILLLECKYAEASALLEMVQGKSLL
jgi:hypothetical protein